MKRIVCSAFLVTLLFTSCASVEKRSPSSSGYLQLLDKNHLVCLTEPRTGDTILIHHSRGNDYSFHMGEPGYKNWGDEASCQEKDRGITCLVKGNTVFRMDYSFQDHPSLGVYANQPAIASFSHAKFDTREYHCYIVEEIPDFFDSSSG